MHSSLKKCFGYGADLSEKKIIKDWKKHISNLCKPCWELKYCPYGPIVEDFPLIPLTRRQCEDHNEYLKQCIETGKIGDGSKLDLKRKKWFKEEIKNYNLDDYPIKIPNIFLEASCKIFGHICPVFFMAEPLTETKERRVHSRSILRDVMLKVVRRDGQICQKCHQPVPDKEVEFDHIIPYSRGGKSTVENLRLVHIKCNRKKSNSLDEILHPRPIEHLWELRNKK
ncbi:MAG: HNH endonuclease signature motif containing protein [Patescibacteria group bacterium]